MTTLPDLKARATAPPSSYKCIDGHTLSEQIGFIKPGPGLDLSKYAYMAAAVSGDCLSLRPGGAVFDGDSVLFRELRGWTSGEGLEQLRTYLGGLVVVSVKGQMMVKELDGVDAVRGVLRLRQYLPEGTRAYYFKDVWRLYVVDEVQQRPVFV